MAHPRLAQCRLTVVIPALNEAERLPALLQALGAQTRPPDEIIVADASSADETCDIAVRHGARVVAGGRPATGRNAGARSATGDYLLFLDADVYPEPRFIEMLLDGYLRSGCDVATCLMEPLSTRRQDRVAFEGANLLLRLYGSWSPRAPGFCILVTRAIHEAIGGFDETLVLSEDHDYVLRAARHGRFAVLGDVRIPVSVRRLDKEGRLRLALMYVWCEAHNLSRRPIRSVPFKYDLAGWAGGRGRRSQAGASGVLPSDPSPDAVGVTHRDPAGPRIGQNERLSNGVGAPAEWPSALRRVANREVVRRSLRRGIYRGYRLVPRLRRHQAIESLMARRVTGVGRWRRGEGE